MGNIDAPDAYALDKALRAFDAKAFWEENRRCFAPFSADKPRAGAGFMFEDHFLLHLLRLENTNRYYEDMPFRLTCHIRANDLMEPALGKRFYPEDRFSYRKGQFEVLLGARRVVRHGNTPWIEPAVEDIAGVKALIARIAEFDCKRDAIPDEWHKTREDLFRKTGRTLRFEDSWNGPTTIAAALLGTTNLCYWMMDEPKIMDDFFEILGQRYIEYREAVTVADNGRVDREGVGVNDDNCYLFPPDAHARFCAPFQRRFYDAFAPSPSHTRRHHSDSAMQHLMENLNAMGVNEVNIAPDVSAAEIRRRMPAAMIHGQLHPSLVKHGSRAEIIAAVRRDIAQAGAGGGLVETVVGVIPESTALDNLRLVLWAVERYGRYPLARQAGVRRGASLIR